MNTFIAQATAMLAVGFFALGNAWIVEGHGLNPMAAFPIATILIILPWVIRKI